jgi:hypothetical protein
MLISPRAIATTVPRAKTKSQVARVQRVKVVDPFSALREVIRLWDNAVPELGRRVRYITLSSRVAKTTRDLTLALASRNVQKRDP